MRIMSRTLPLPQYQKWIDKAYTVHGDDDVKAIAFIVDCPGGCPAQSELLAKYIARKAAASNVPTYGFAESMAASGGYVS